MNSALVGHSGTIIDWISSGVPISQPEPQELARELLTKRGLYLFDDSSASPCTHNRRGIGYVSSNAELINLAYRVRDNAAATTAHPIALATQWIMTGFPADAGLLDQVRLTAAEWSAHSGMGYPPPWIAPTMNQQPVPGLCLLYPDRHD